VRFTPNYPNFDPARPGLLPTPTRINASADCAGRGVVIAFIDSGFYPHPDLGERVLIHVDCTTRRPQLNRRFGAARDYAWHGQMTSVIAAGDGRTSAGRYIGVAPEARLVLIKVSTPLLRIKESDILRGLRWLLAHHRAYGVRICNISVGGDFFSDDPAHPLHKAVAALHAEGVCVLVAAGNTGVPPLVPPASAPEAITVGGYDDSNTLDVTVWRGYRNSFGQAYDGGSKPEVISAAAWVASPILPGSLMSREAPWLAAMLGTSERALRRLLFEAAADLDLTAAEVAAPTERLYARLEARLHKHKVVDAHHQHVEGTSVSSAIVAGVVAQMLEANPALHPMEVRAILCETALLLPDVPPERQGAGVVDAGAAVALASALARAKPRTV
jgi:serine protease AprX